MHEIKYFIDGEGIIQEDTIAICNCQFEVCSPKCALDELFYIKINESGVSISNTSEDDRCIVLKIPPKSTVTVDAVKRIELIKDIFDSGLIPFDSYPSSKKSVIITREDDPLRDNSDVWI